MNTSADAQTLPEYLASLSEGSTVYILTRGGGHARAKVTRTTKTQIVCGHSRYRLQDGQLIGANAYERSNIVLPSQRIIEKTRNSELDKWAQNQLPRSFLDFSLEQKEQLFALAASMLRANREATGSGAN